MINSQKIEKKVPSFRKMCAIPCFYVGNRWLRNLQASTPLFKDVHGPQIQEGNLKNEDLFESFTEKYVFMYYME